MGCRPMSFNRALPRGRLRIRHTAGMLIGYAKAGPKQPGQNAAAKPFKISADLKLHTSNVPGPVCVMHTVEFVKQAEF